MGEGVVGVGGGGEVVGGVLEGWFYEGRGSPGESGLGEVVL